MLFDLRSKGRRRTVQVVYLGLALVLGGGLVLFGVGTGSGNGGLLNAFGGGGGGSGQSSAVSAEETAALSQIKQNPNDAEAWGKLLEARWTTAINGSDYGATGFTAAGRAELGRTIQAWDRYTQLASSPDPDLATLAARAYVALGNYAGAANAWQLETASTPSPKGYECLAVNAYAARQTRVGDLASAKALKLLPTTSEQSTVKLTLNQAKTSTTAAQNSAAGC